MLAARSLSPVLARTARREGCLSKWVPGTPEPHPTKTRGGARRGQKGEGCGLTGRAFRLKLVFGSHHVEMYNVSPVLGRGLREILTGIAYFSLASASFIRDLDSGESD